MNHINPWRVAETNDLREEAEKRGYTFLFLDGKSSVSKQVEDSLTLIEQGVEYLILAPLTMEGYEPVVERCRELSIPLIILDREIVGEPKKDFLTFIGSDFFNEGVMAATYLAELTKGSGKVVEINGNVGASCTIYRQAGFHSVIDAHPSMQVVAEGWGDYERILGQKAMEEVILSYGTDFDAVYAHNDDMAIGAIQALKAANIRPGEDVLIISIDGSRDALKSIIAGELAASVECNPRLGSAVFDVIDDHRRGKPIPPRIVIEDRLFDISNAEALYLEGF